MSIRISKRMLNMSIRMGEGMWMRRGLSGWRHECMGSGWPSLHASVAPGETPTSATIGLLRNWAEQPIQELQGLWSKMQNLRQSMDLGVVFMKWRKARCWIASQYDDLWKGLTTNTQILSLIVQTFSCPPSICLILSAAVLSPSSTTGRRRDSPPLRQFDSPSLDIHP